MGNVVKSGDLKFVKVNDNNLLVSLQSLTSAEGASPLSLTDSAGLNLSAYQIDGQTVQSSPLPSGYTQVEYLQSSGTQYIDTNFVANQDTGTEMKFALDSLNYANFIFGARTNGSSNYYAFLQVNSAWRTDYNQSAYSFGTSDTNVHTVNKNKNLTYFDNTLTTTQTYATFSTSVNMYLFGVNNGGTFSNPVSAKIYYTKIWDNGTLVRDYVPAIRTSDSTAGLYDLVNNVFYTNAGTGTFTTGPAVTTPTPDVPWPIESLGERTRNLSTENWRQGDWNNTGTGSRVSTNDKIFVANGETVTFSYDYSLNLMWSAALLPTASSTTYYSTISWKTAQYTFTANRDTYIVVVWAKINEAVSIVPSDVAHASFMVEQGSVATPYIPYHAIEVISRGKNLIPYPYFSTTVTHNGITYTDNGDGSITINGTPTGGSSYFILQTNADYGDSINGYGSATNGTYTVVKTNATSEPYMFYNSDNKVLSINVNPGTIVNNYVFKPQLEYGTTLTPYEPYQTPITATIDLTGHEPLSCVGSVCDYIDFKNQRVVRNVGEMEFDGTEGWATYGGYMVNPSAWQTSVFAIDIPQKQIGYHTSICDHFYNSNDGAAFTNTLAKNGLYTDHPNLTTAYFDYGASGLVLNDFKSWLAAQATAGTPVTVQYQLATPTTESLSLPKVEIASGSASLWATDGNLQSSNLQVHYWQE